MPVSVPEMEGLNQVIVPHIHNELYLVRVVHALVDDSVDHSEGIGSELLELLRLRDAAQQESSR
jgi:hypothetical protein